MSDYSAETPRTMTASDLARLPYETRETAGAVGARHDPSPPGAGDTADATSRQPAATRQDRRFVRALAAPLSLPYLTIGLGSAIGGVARYECGVAVGRWLGAGFPWGTIFVNIVGSLFIGFFAALTGPEGRLLVGTQMRQAVMVGLCGGYTTFSSFSLENAQLLRQGEPFTAVANIGASLVLCLIAVWLGHSAAAKINR